MKTATRTLCLFLTLLLVVSLMAIPAAAVNYGSYAATVKTAIGANDKTNPGCGMLSDLNGDGTDEMLLLCRNNGAVALSVYTLSGNAVTALMTDRLLYTESDGTDGEAAIVKHDGKLRLQVTAETSASAGTGDKGARTSVTGNSELYALTNGKLETVSRVEYKYTYVMTTKGDREIESDGFTCTETAGSASGARTVQQLEKWFGDLDEQARLDVLPQDDTNDGLPLNMLLGRLEGRIGAFQDVPSNEWFSDSVEWALLHAVTDGTTDTTFSPNAVCTRAHMVTFLWRTHGSPKVALPPSMPFTDVPKTEYYYDAVLWAVKLGITDGVTATTFAPDATLTRGQTVTFLWRDACHPSAAIARFADVPKDEYYADAVGWAQEIGVTDGMTATTFVPNGSCTRAQIVTFISRAVCAPGVHAQDVTGLQLDRKSDYSTDNVGKDILFTFVGDVEDFNVTSVMLTAREGLKPDKNVYDLGAMADGASFLLRTDVPDVAANYGVTFTVGSRTVTWAITTSGENGSIHLVEL